MRGKPLLFGCVVYALFTLVLGAEKLTIATYNVENFHLAPYGNRSPKDAAARAMVAKQLLAIAPDVVAFQEMGNLASLFSLREELRRGGLDLPFHEHITGYDTNIHLAVLSRVPIVARRPRTNESYLLNGRRLHVSRGILEIDLKTADGYAFTLLNGHLKSKREVGFADQAGMRLEEAKAMRRIVDDALRRNPRVNLMVVGDFNDTKNTPPVRTLVGRGRTALIDTRPGERNGDNLPPLRRGHDPRTVTWTYFYGLEDSYTRFDYILLAPGMTPKWIEAESYVYAGPNWGLAADHRPVVVTIDTAKD